MSWLGTRPSLERQRVSGAMMMRLRRSQGPMRMGSRSVGIGDRIAGFGPSSNAAAARDPGWTSAQALNFAGRELALAAYRHAVEARYRFFSYGDSMLIV